MAVAGQPCNHVGVQVHACLSNVLGGKPILPRLLTNCLQQLSLEQGGVPALWCASTWLLASHTVVQEQECFQQDGRYGRSTDPSRNKLQGFASIAGRDLLRRTWVPRGAHLRELERNSGIVIRFVIGRS